MFNISIILGLFKDYGYGLAGFAIIVRLLWIIANNHLKHISDDVKSVGKDVKALTQTIKEDKKELNEKIDGLQTKADALGERIAKVEGKLE